MHNITTPTHILTHKLCIEWIRYCGLSMFGYCWLTKTFYLCEKFPTCKTYGKYKVCIIRLLLFHNKNMGLPILFSTIIFYRYLWLTHIFNFINFQFLVWLKYWYPLFRLSQENWMTNVYFLFQSHYLGRKSAVKCYEAWKHSKYTCQAHYIQHDYVNKKVPRQQKQFSLLSKRFFINRVVILCSIFGFNTSW